jgi:hypothetical protein
MGIVSRLRQYVHAKHDAAKNDRVQEAEAYTAQINSIEERAEMIRRCVLLVFVSLAGTIASCLLAGTIHYIREVVVALSSGQNEARDSRFMDLGAPPKIRAHNPL